LVFGVGWVLPGSFSQALRLAATPAGDWTSVAVCSDGSYGIEKGLMFSFPIRSTGTSWEIVQDVPVNEFSQGKINATETELKEERTAVQELGLI
jgi:malate dehydrogenase